MFARPTLHWPIHDGGDAFLPEPVGGAHDYDLVLDGERVHVVDHHVIGGREQGGLAGQRGVFVQNDLKYEC